MSAEVATQGELRELYRELILDHARNPRHYGNLDKATHRSEGLNPLCGDRLCVELEIDAAGIIVNLSFSGSGCAISVASASIMTDTVIGLECGEATRRLRAVISLLKGDRQHQEDIELARIRALAGVREFPARVKCATLAWHALNSAINEDGTRTTTE